jgi:hypothetical protein
MKRLQLSFDTCFDDDELDWHWNYFIKNAPGMFNFDSGDEDIVREFWESHMYGAVCEEGRMP